MLNTPWQPDDIALAARARRAARLRNASVPGLAAFSARESRAAAAVRRPRYWRRTSPACCPNCFSYAAMYACATFLIGFAAGISSMTSIGPAARIVPFDLFLAEPDEFLGGHGVRLVDASLVALVEQRRLRQHRRAADRRDQDRVGLRRHQLQHLSRHALVGARVALVGDDADAGLLGRGRRTPCTSSRRTDR